MAQRIETILTDDLDPSISADETVSFGIDRKVLEIDLSAGHAQALRESMAEYVAAARKAGGAKPSASGERMDKSVSQAIRAWAGEQGMQLAGRGRLPHAVVSAYNEAH